LGSGDVRDVSLRNGNIAASDPGENSAGEEQGERLRHSHEREAGRGADDANQKDRPATVTIGKFAKDRREDDLHAGINPGEPADGDGRGVEVLRVKRQNRNDDAETHEVDEDGEEKDEERW